jgi:tRNA-modifying protein YgfZ
MISTPAMLLDLSERAKFKVTGSDRVRYLNGQLTNDILKLRQGSAISACALTAKGKLCADLFVAAANDSHFLDADAVLRESLAGRLEKYIIADDVTLEDVTEEFGLFHLTGSASAETAWSEWLVENNGFLVASDRFGVPGIDLWFPADRAAFVLEKLKLAPVDSETAENLRIEHGVARWGYELSENVIPSEAGLDERAISFSKGCYLGQEVISRIKSVGHVNRHLYGLLPGPETVLALGDKLFSEAESSKEIGLVTSIGQSRSLGRTIALGYVRRGFDAPGTTLQVRRNNTSIGSVEIRSLPF